jgi:hypothetical protein
MNVGQVLTSSSDPSINGLLHYPNDIDRSLNEVADDEIRKYHVDYNNNPPNDISFVGTYVCHYKYVWETT